ncbi:AAA family ATPase [Chryseobacterium sp. BIGb0232]|uniref:AAA family ATPase n=1 Tax=Chryseobacterium sp. BIGb0232 TaxID=2940598 RepID=UPI000F476872|nr:AAA family ATPase [Chryseobacterium sp. BIGb0232]MCS4304886.1 putative ATP-binding protein involved in virulence [Chryseobacterium sp. BIGb0232]ROS09694.1 putative ATP-binding protein involved in virulence [Chryseobacterium nakagawai]
MAENFITNIFVEKSRNVNNFEIPLSNLKRQHLILTGKNGSGKTSLLNEINKYLSKIDNGEYENLENNQKNYTNYTQTIKEDISESDRIQYQKAIKNLHDWFESFGGTKISFSGIKNDICEKVSYGSFILAFFDSKRHISLKTPVGINKIDIKKKYGLTEKANLNFIQYIVNLKADRSFARDDNEVETVKKIDDWFNRFENSLKALFDINHLELRFDRRTYNFDIITDNNEPFNFNTLSDGYSAIISIITELLLRMEAHEVKSYDLEGIVIIDEIETHLHVDLQKKILPFLIDFFPKIQFIVTTHSPFVLSSISNATICDLETKIITTDLSSYSYDALIESYFRSDKYSEEVKKKISDFENLIIKENLSALQKDYLRELRNYFTHSPKYLSTELMVKLQELQLKEITNKKN